MKAQRYRLVRRGNVYYFHDNLTGNRESTGKTDKEEAGKLLFAKNESARQPALNLAMARTYAMGQCPKLATRTWQDVMDDRAWFLEKHREASTLKRWMKVCRSKPFSLIRKNRLIETQAEHFHAVLGHKQAGSSTNGFLRTLHQHALDMGWLLAPVLPKKKWPQIRYGEKRSITQEEHERLVEDARNAREWRLFLETLWETGGSQSDIAMLTDERIDWEQNILFYRRMKMENRGYEYAKVLIGSKLREVLAQLPEEGYLFPKLAEMDLENRARRFRRRCQSLGIKGVTLHSYRYAWAERARKAGMPERAAMEVLGHQSRLVHRAYAKKVRVDVMPLEYYEKKAEEKVIELKNYPSRVEQVKKMVK